MTDKRLTLRAPRWPVAIAIIALAALVTVPAFASAPRSGSRAAPRAADLPKPTIVLVHGGWADGSSWDEVIASLQREGYTVDAPPNPLRRLPSDSAYLPSYLTTISDPT